MGEYEWHIEPLWNDRGMWVAWFTLGDPALGSSPMDAFTRLLRDIVHASETYSEASA